MRFHNWLGISLLIHAAVVLPFMFHAFSVPPPTARGVTLDLELFGMLSDRIEEESDSLKTPEIPSAPPEQEPLTELEKPPFLLLEEPLPELVTSALDSPVEYIEEPLQLATVVESQTLSINAGPAMSAESASGDSGVFLPRSESGIGSVGGTGKGADGSVPAGVSGETTRRGRTGDADIINRYTYMVARRLQSNLVYPASMRRKGIEAMTVVVFTVTKSGEIKDGSLEVRTGSGYKEMDENALKSVRLSVPFDVPPRELTLSIELVFEVGRSRR